MPVLPPWAERARRAHQNTNENLLHFGIFVLAVHYLDLSNDLTALGATIFFWSRIGYVVVYIAGIPWTRTALFFTGLGGEAIVAYRLIATSL